jgi:hypothetical protein
VSEEPALEARRRAGEAGRREDEEHCPRQPGDEKPNKADEDEGAAKPEQDGAQPPPSSPGMPRSRALRWLVQARRVLSLRHPGAAGSLEPALTLT